MTKFSTLSLLAGAALLMPLASQAAPISYIDTFNSDGTGNPLGTVWNTKWQSDNAGTPENEATQQALLNNAAGNTARVNTSAAWRNYHMVNQQAITVAAGETLTVSVDMNYTHDAGGDITANFNKNFLGVMLSTTKNWWDGSNKVVSLANRGGAIGNTLPMAPWIENWVPHNSVGVNTTTGGTSEWITVDWTITVNGAGNLQGTASFSKTSDGSPLGGPTTAVDLGITAGTTVYAGLSTDWNDVGNVSIQSFSKISNVGIDNFSINIPVVPEPASLALLGLGGIALLGRRRSA